jgi:hypothetical protein
MGACGATAENVKRLLPPRQSQGISLVSLDQIFSAFSFGPPFDPPFRFFAKESVDRAPKSCRAVDTEYEFADGSSSPANAIIVGVGVGLDPSLPRSIRVELRFTPRFDDNSARAHLAARDTAADCRDGLP